MFHSFGEWEGPEPSQKQSKTTVSLYVSGLLTPGLDIAFPQWFFNVLHDLTPETIILQLFLIVFQIIVSIIAINRVMIVSGRTRLSSTH